MSPRMWRPTLQHSVPQGSLDRVAFFAEVTFYLIGVQSQCSYHGLKCKHSSLGTILRSQARQNQEAGASGLRVLVRPPAPQP